jgi:hypothetical protein
VSAAPAPPKTSFARSGEKVGVVGIPVQTVEQFNNMTEADLIGPAPKTKRGDP